MAFSVLTRKGKVPRHNFHPPRPQSWLRGGRSPLAVPSQLVSHTLPSCHPWGNQAPNPTSLQSPQVTQEAGARSHKLQPRQMATAIRSQKQGWGKGFTTASNPGPKLVKGLSEDSGALQGIVPSLSPGPFSLPAGPRLGELEELQEKAWICLLPHSPPDDHHTTDPWLNHFPNGPSLLVDRAHCSTDQ